MIGHQNRLSLYLTLLLLLSLVFPHELLSTENPTIRVGIYQNNPKIFIDESGNPSGIFVDILRQIALENDWSIHYVPGEWYECLERLESGEIDLMPDVAWSKERAEIYDFNEETVLNNWGQIYVPHDSEIETIPQLQGKTIAVMRGDYSYAEFRQNLADFGVSCKFLEVNSFEEVFQTLDAHEADAGIISRFFGIVDQRDHQVNATSIMCCPARLLFAVTKGDPKLLLSPIDASLATMKQYDNSIYYVAISRWLDRPVEWHWPLWARYFLVFLAGVLAALIVAAITLKLQVRKITNELLSAQEKVIQNQRLSALGEMASGIVHDFRNYLTPILGNVDMLLMHAEKWPDKSFMQPILEQIRKAVDDSEEIVERLQEFYRPRENSETLEPVDLNLVVSESMDLAQHRSRNLGKFKMVQEFSSRTKIMGNPGELREAVINLIFNAIDAMQDGGTLTCITRDADDKVSLIIRDTGSGMSEEVKGRALEPFFTTKAEGTGMGLAMVYGTVVRHNGTIQIDSKPGQGTTIRLTFPTRKPHASD
ncbi:MAG: transporter substrate-binding domain-containing protein [Lentisphaeria bacterium]|nr:transporter substrate-binding domain-containing protein [Candidatus Neomarinimicrobiota bacterium]MCF7842154.1 transporter substrate-binding domain-containing protein [Lentisphaeria bacterium]